MMLRLTVAGTILAAVGLFGTTAAFAAGDVGVGGYHDLALDAARRDLLAGKPAASPEDDIGLQIMVDDGPDSALTVFTPRVGSLSLGVAGQPRRVQVGLGDSTEISGWKIDLSASAGVASAGAGTEVEKSGLVVGGRLAVAGVRFDASYGEDAALLGLDGRRMTAGVAYEFGGLDTHMSYSLVEREQAFETSLITVGSRLTLTPGLVVQGDVAFAEDEGGAATTAGRVSLRLNF